MAPYTLLLTLALAITAASVPCNTTTNTRPTATIDSGVVVGTTTSLPFSSNTVNKFLGIPFAEPPVRFSPPQPVEPWQSTYDASEYKPACIQQFNHPKIIEWFDTPGPPAGESEDCLNLNVYAPASAAEGSKAVLFWIYGGSFVFGSGSSHLYDGSSFAANEDIVVVTINYRTNVFGFPGSPDVSKEEKNLGWLDQRLALDWVQRNIAALGGDPARVTIAGESAGSGSVDVLVTAPPDPVPFHAAIMQSGQATINAGLNDSATSWEVLVKAAKCPSDDALECIRAIPALEIKEILEQQKLPFGPVHDGGATWADASRKDRLESTDQESLIARVPILIGSNADEGRHSAIAQNDTEAYLRGSFPEGTPEQVIKLLLDTYPIGAPGLSNEFDRISAIGTEFQFQCPSKIVAEESAEVGIHSWRYFYNASFPNTEIFPGSGAYHTAEIEPVFGTYPQEGATKFQVDLSKAMQYSWAKFMKDPTCGPGWDEAPRLAVFGGGASPGVDDLGREVLVTVDPEYVDRRCEVYQPLFNAYG